MNNTKSVYGDSKVFETKERTTPLRIRVRTWDDTPNRFVMVEEKRHNEWSRTGSVELGYGPIDSRGVCDANQLAQWSHTRFHATGDRVRVDRRLRVDERPNEGYAIFLEERRKQTLGDGLEEHDWKPVDEWMFEVPTPGGRA